LRLPPKPAKRARIKSILKVCVRRKPIQQENDENIRIQPLVLRRYGSSAQFGIQPASQRPASDQRLQSHSGRRQKPEVGGLIVCVSTSPFRTACISFEREYPDQTLAGFIASSQESLTLVARKTIPLLFVALSLILTASHSHAGLGWTLAQFEQQYGNPVINQEQIAGRTGYVFAGQDYIVAAFFLNRRASRIMYICRSGSVFDWGRARALLSANAPDGIWDDAFKSETDNSYRVNGAKDGVEKYYASLTRDGTMLVIWTKEDDEATRASPKLDTPLLSSVMDSNEKSTGETTEGHAPSIDGGSTPKLDQSDVVQANATCWSPSQRPDSAHGAHTKIFNVRLRSSKHPRYVDVKTRLIALWHQSLPHRKSSGREFSNSKKVGYTGETRH
jgi:hypothetical protein